MKAFICISALVAATSAQLIGHHAGHLGHLGHVGHAVGYGGGQTSHVSVSKPYQGEVRSNAQSKAFGSPIASHSSHDSVANTAAHGVAAHLGQGAVLGPAYHAAPVVHAAPAYHAAPVHHAVHHAAPAYHAAPVVHAAPAYHAPVHAVAHAVAEVSPYTYNYAVADDYSNSNFNAGESSDGLGNAEGSYSVALPDGRIQHVNYHSDPVNGYVAEVTYDGPAAYPEAVVAHAAPVHAVAHHAVAPLVHAAPVVHATHAVAHAAPLVHGGLVHHG